MMRYLLDTDTCIYVLRERPPDARERFNANDGRMAISTITWFELVYGAEYSREPERNLSVVEGFAERLEVMPFGVEAGAHAGQIRAELRRAGTPIGAYDLLIAAQARASGLVLVSRNRREFERVPGLRLETWV